MVEFNLHELSHVSSFYFRSEYSATNWRWAFGMHFHVAPEHNSIRAEYVVCTYARISRHDHIYLCPMRGLSLCANLRNFSNFDPNSTFLVSTCTSWGGLFDYIYICPHWNFYVTTTKITLGALTRGPGIGGMNVCPRKLEPRTSQNRTTSARSMFWMTLPR